jgi:hypothetical protein
VTTSPIQAWLDRLRRRFSPALLRLGSDGTQPLAGGGGSSVLALVGRELCLYLHVDATRVPQRQREAYVALAVRRAAPFADPGHDILWCGDHACAWYWSRARVRALAPDVSRHRAEALFRGGLHRDDVVELLALDTQPAEGESFNAGFEARAWRGGRLEASRWWPALPDARSWQEFLRGTGLDADAGMPEPQSSPLLARPLDSAGARVAFAGRVGAQPQLIALAVATLAIAAVAWQGASALRVAWRAHSAERQIESLSAGMTRILDARERADASRARIDAVLALHAPASQTRLLGEVKRLTPGNWQLMVWSQPSPEVLEVTLRAPAADVPAIVSAWDSSPYLQEVTPATSSRQDEVILQAKLTPIAEQGAAAR